MDRKLVEVPLPRTCSKPRSVKEVRVRCTVLVETLVDADTDRWSGPESTQSVFVASRTAAVTGSERSSRRAFSKGSENAIENSVMSWSVFR